MHLEIAVIKTDRVWRIKNKHGIPSAPIPEVGDSVFFEGMTTARKVVSRTFEYATDGVCVYLYIEGD